VSHVGDVEKRGMVILLTVSEKSQLSSYCGSYCTAVNLMIFVRDLLMLTKA